MYANVKAPLQVSERLYDSLLDTWDMQGFCSNT